MPTLPAALIHFALAFAQWLFRLLTACLRADWAFAHTHPYLAVAVAVTGFCAGSFTFYRLALTLRRF